jgi:hypothetical protein
MTLTNRAPSLVTVDNIFRPFAKPSGFLCILDSTLLLYMLTRHRGGWVMSKRDIILSLACIFVHLMDATLPFYTTTRMFTGREMWQVFTMAMWFVHIVSCSVNAPIKNEGRGERKALPAPVRGTVLQRYLGPTGYFDAPWVKFEWNLYFVGVYVLFLVFNIGEETVKNVTRLACESIYQAVIGLFS